MMNVRIERLGEQWVVSLWEGHVKVASGGDTTVKKAAAWLVRSMHRKLDKLEDAVLEMGLLTADELTAISDGEDEK
jgi:hypothetical protein